MVAILEGCTREQRHLLGKKIGSVSVKTLLKYENRPWKGYVVTVGVLGRYESPNSNEGCCFKSRVQFGEFLGGSCWGSIKHTSHGDMAALGGGDVEVTAGQMQGLVNNAFFTV